MEKITHSVDLCPNDLCVSIRAAGATSFLSTLDFLSILVHYSFPAAFLCISSVLYSVSKLKMTTSQANLIVTEV